jgi:hypothetical protein
MRFDPILGVFSGDLATGLTGHRAVLCVAGSKVPGAAGLRGEKKRLSFPSVHGKHFFKNIKQERG